MHIDLSERHFGYSLLGLYKLRLIMPSEYSLIRKQTFIDLYDIVHCIMNYHAIA